MRAWSHLINQDHGVGQQKQFETEQSDAIHAFDDAAGKRLGPFGHAGSHQCRGERRPQNPLLVFILHQRKDDHLSVDAARGEN
jgi:hypothetical protein